MPIDNRLKLKTQLACAKRIYKLTAQAQRDADEKRLQTVLDQHNAQTAYDKNPSEENRKTLEKAKQAYQEANEKWLKADCAAYYANLDKTKIEKLLTKKRKNSKKRKTK